LSPGTPARTFWGCALRLGGIALAVLVVLVAALSLNQRLALRRFRQRTPPPGRLVDVGGRHMHLRCTGSGAPTVVIDAGNGCFSLEWAPVQDQLAEVTRVCTYDRAGYGWSDPAPSPRDGAAAVADLHALLLAAGEPGPFLLVGHSLGGAHVRLSVAAHPDRVAGLVLVDAPPAGALSPDMEASMRGSIGFYQAMRLLTSSGLLRVLGPLGGEDAMPETARKLPPALQDAYLNLVLDPQQHATALDEMVHLPDTLRQLRPVSVDGALGDLPLIVLTAGQQMAPGSTPFDGRRVAVAQAQIDAQAALASLSAHGEQRLIAHSGHQVHLDAPEAVVAAVSDLVTTIRSRTLAMTP
jgi:pimeloyl-ACP methyl ester carboxylesterase